MDALAQRSTLLLALKELLGRENLRPFDDHLSNIRMRLSKAERLVIFGAGQNGRMLALLLRHNGFLPAAFFDDTPTKIGTTVCGLPVEAVPCGRPHVATTVVSSVFSARHGFLPVQRRLSQVSIEVVSLFEALLCSETSCLPFYFLDKPNVLLDNCSKIEWLAELLSDENSLTELLSHVSFRVSLDHRVLSNPAPRQILPFKNLKNLVYVDAGAFDGDTLLPFVNETLESLSLAIGVEPDSENFNRLDNAIKAAPDFIQKKIRTVKAALDCQSGVKRFSGGHSEESALCRDGGQVVETISADELLKNTNFSAVYLKLDVEGAEAQAILGARSLIEAGSAILSISVYHKPTDLWDLPELVHGINADYRFLLRSHGCDGADLTLYAFHEASHRSLLLGSV